LSDPLDGVRDRRMVFANPQAVLVACGGYLVHPFTNQMDVLLITSCFSELWYSQIKACKSISRVYLSHAEHTLFIFSCGGS
jgi:hypothetical protein